MNVCACARALGSVRVYARAYDSPAEGKVADVHACAFTRACSKQRKPAYPRIDFSPCRRPVDDHSSQRRHATEAGGRCFALFRQSNMEI